MNVMRKCCGLCPYSRKNTLFLYPERAYEFGLSAENPFNDFVCHKTGITIEDHPDENKQNEIVRGEKSLTCAGFHAMQSLINGTDCEIEIDFEDHFSDTGEMEEHHAEHQDNKKATS